MGRTKVDFTFDRDKVEQWGYTVDAVHQTIKKNFAAKGLRCVEDGETLSFADNGGENDFSSMWAIMMTLLRADWFTLFASSCTWHDDDGSSEDVLSQAWKVRNRIII